jgi:actin
VIRFYNKSSSSSPQGVFAFLAAFQKRSEWEFRTSQTTLCSSNSTPCCTSNRFAWNCRPRQHNSAPIFLNSFSASRRSRMEIDANDLQLFYVRFLERAKALPPQHVPILYRHLLMQSCSTFADRWRLAASDKLKLDTFTQFPLSVDQTVDQAIVEFVDACLGETVEISARGVDSLPNLYRADCDSLFVKASILHEGTFVGQANAFSLKMCMRLFGLRSDKNGYQAGLILPSPAPPLYAAPTLWHAASAESNMVVLSRSCVYVSCSNRNRTACSLSAWLCCALVCGRNFRMRNFDAKAASHAAKIIIMYRNRMLCSRIVYAAATCPVVIDCYSLLMRAGFADASPSAIFPSVMCRRRYPPGCHISTTSRWRPFIFGHEALDKTFAREHGSLIVFPVQNGIVTNWDCMEQLWLHAFTKLKVDPANHPVLLTEVIMNPKSNRERMVQVMFETLSVPALYICSRPVLCLAGSRRSSGVVVQCNASESIIVPVIDGHILPHAVFRACFHSGDDLTSHMITLLRHHGITLPSYTSQQADSFTHDSDSISVQFTTRSLVRSLQEALCYVALDYDLEMQTASEATYELPPLYQGRFPTATISIGHERFACPEILFRPLLPSIEGMHIATDSVIKACDVSVQHHLYGNIVLAGDALALPGMVARMEREMRAVAPGARVTVRASAKHSTWTGGAILASSHSFLRMCMLNAIYNEQGPTIVHTKCPTFAPL